MLKSRCFERISYLILVSAAPLALFVLEPAWGEVRPEKVQTSDVRKTNVYLPDGVVVGGDRAINDPVITGIRRAGNAGFDRVVIDIEANVNGSPAPIPRPPYYQVAVNKEEKRVVVTVSGNPRLSFDSEKVLAGFGKSPVVNKVMLFPRMNEASWTFALELKAAAPIEVFELTDPVRIVIDIRR